MVVSDDDFRRMLGREPSEYMTLSAKSLLGDDTSVESSLTTFTQGDQITSLRNGDQQESLLPNDIQLVHRNSFLEEIEKNGCFAKLFVRIVVKEMEKEMDDPNDDRQRKMIREVARNLPLRCLAIFSRGGMSYDVLDSLIAMFNGQYFSAMRHLSTSARNGASSVFGCR
jgi:hypothetical protein